MRVQRILAVAVVLLFLVSIAFGQTRGRTEHFAIPFTVVGEEVASCGDFNLLSDYVIMFKGVKILDEEGQEVKRVVQVKIMGQGEYYNSEYPELSLLTGPGEVQINHWDWESGTLAITGIPWKVNVPGYGWIVMETGRSVIDINTWQLIFESGHSQDSDAAIAAICNYLTPK